MVIYLKAGGMLRDALRPDVDQYTRRVETEAGKPLSEILTSIGIDPALVAFAMKDGELKRLGYVPSEGDVITLQPPVWGG
jgi:hypothetical protein